MRDILIVLGICVAAIALGLALYMYGPKEFREAPSLENTQGVGAALSADTPTTVSFTVLATGERAASISERKNYAVYDEEEFARIWQMAYGDSAPALPEVDFSTKYVIGVFAGEKPTGGHTISVVDVVDHNSLRTVGVSLARPGATCVVTQAFTSPFQFVSVPLTDRDHVRDDRTVETGC